MRPRGWLCNTMTNEDLQTLGAMLGSSNSAQICPCSLTANHPWSTGLANCTSFSQWKKVEHYTRLDLNAMAALPDRRQ